MLDAGQLEEFEELGFTRIRGFAETAAAAMRAVAWQELEHRYDVRPDTANAWPQYVTGMKRTKHDRAFDPIGGAALASALDQLLGPGAWSLPKHWGQVMITAPTPDKPWRLPSRLWHIDFEYTPQVGELFAVKVLAFFGDVVPRGGGTLLIAGSHRMTARYVAELSPDERADYRRTRDSFLRHHPWLRALSSADDDPARVARFMDDDGDVDGVPARVIELTGAPGDIVLTHPWMYHCAAPNATRVPRLMRGKSIRRERAFASYVAPEGPRAFKPRQ